MQMKTKMERRLRTSGQMLRHAVPLPFLVALLPAFLPSFQRSLSPIVLPLLTARQENSNSFDNVTYASFALTSMARRFHKHPK